MGVYVYMWWVEIDTSRTYLKNNDDDDTGIRLLFQKLQFNFNFNLDKTSSKEISEYDVKEFPKYQKHPSES